MVANGNLLSLNEAAKKVRKSPSTIHKYLKNGKLSFVSKDDNGYQIDPSELLRVFPTENGANIRDEQSRINANGGEKDIEYKELEHQLELIRKDLTHETKRADAAEAARDDLSKKLDAVQETLNRQTKLLSPPAGNSPYKPVEGDKNRSGRVGAETSKKSSQGPQIALYGVLLLAVLALGYLASEINTVRRDIEAIPPERDYKPINVETLREVLSALEPAPAVGQGSAQTQPVMTDGDMAAPDDGPAEPAGWNAMFPPVPAPVELMATDTDVQK